MNSGIYEQMREKFILPNAYQDWTKYRKKVTELIIESAKVKRSDDDSGVKHKKIAIIGAGRCNDFDLVEIIQRYVGVTLIDIDADSMEGAISWMPERVRSRVTIKPGTITGITEEDQKNFCNGLLAEIMNNRNSFDQETFTGIIKNGQYKLAKKLNQFEKDFVEMLPENEYDVVVCLGVHSQLFSVIHYFVKMLMVNVADQIFHGAVLDGTEIEELFKAMNDNIIPVLNSALIKCAGTRLILGNELDIVNPIEGAYQCIRNMRMRELNMSEQYLEWNFNPENNVKYNMLIQIVDK